MSVHTNPYFAWSSNQSLMSRVLLQKLIVALLMKRVPASYGTRTFITVFTKANHWSLFRTRLIESTLSQSISLRSVLILFSHLCLGRFPSGFQTKNFYPFLISPTRVTYPAHLILLDLITLLTYGEEYALLSPLLCSFLHPSVTSSLSDLNILLIAMFSNTLNLHSEDGGSKILRNVGILPHHYTASQPRRARLESSSPWKTQIPQQRTRFESVYLSPEFCFDSFDVLRVANNHSLENDFASINQSTDALGLSTVLHSKSCKQLLILKDYPRHFTRSWSPHTKRGPVYRTDNQ
jgi:hypothetical protein